MRTFFQSRNRPTKDNSLFPLSPPPCPPPRTASNLSAGGNRPCRGAGGRHVKGRPTTSSPSSRPTSTALAHPSLADHPDSPMAAALAYAQVYFLAIWKAAVLGVVLGAAGAGADSTRLAAAAVRPCGFCIDGARRPVCCCRVMCSCCAGAGGGECAGSRYRWAPRSHSGSPIGIESGNIGVHGFCAGLRALPLCGWWRAWRWCGAMSLIAQRIATPDSMPQPPWMRLPQPGRPGSTSFPGTLDASCGSFSGHSVYIVAVLALGAARVWLFPHIDASIGNSLLCGSSRWRWSALFVIPTAAEIPDRAIDAGAGTGHCACRRLADDLASISLPSLLMLRKSFSARVLVVVSADHAGRRNDGIDRRRTALIRRRTASRDAF